jgi:hypothetical protein
MQAKYLDIFMPPLIAKWQQLPNSDKDLFPLLECFTSIAQVLLFPSVKDNLVVLKSKLALPKYQRSVVPILAHIRILILLSQP